MAKEQTRWIQKGEKVTELYMNGEGWGGKSESLQIVFCNSLYRIYEHDL